MILKATYAWKEYTADSVILQCWVMAELNKNKKKH
jgi:hypothetical protein